MSRIVICVALLTVFVAHANAQESRGKVSVGLAFSGPTYGVSVRTKFTDRFNGRLIYLVDEWFQAQIQFKPNALNNTHYIFGAGRLLEMTISCVEQLVRIGLIKDHYQLLLTSG